MRNSSPLSHGQVSEAFPYLSQRLLTDDSPRAKAALRSMLYGSEDRDASNAAPDFAQMFKMGEGFTQLDCRHMGR